MKLLINSSLSSCPLIRCSHVLDKGLSHFKLVDNTPTNRLWDAPDSQVP